MNNKRAPDTFNKYFKWIASVTGGILVIAIAWFFLPILLGEKQTMILKLSLHHAVGPSIASSSPKDSKELPNVSIAIDVDSAKKSQSEFRGDLIQHGNTYPIKFTTEKLHSFANPSYSELKVKLRKDQSYNEMEEFEILPPVSPSQLSEWIKREIARNIGFEEIGKFFPITLQVNGQQIGLRFVSALPELLSMDISNVPYLKLFCRVSPGTVEEERKLTGAAKSKIPVRPDEEWSISAPTLGEGVSGPEFTQMKKLSSKVNLSRKEEHELFRLVDEDFFGRYAAIATLVDGVDIEDILTPSSFRFEHISGRIRPSFQLCNIAGLIPHNDGWFRSLMEKLNTRPEFIAAYNKTVELLASKTVKANLLDSLQKVVEAQLIPSINATPYRYALHPSGEIKYVYGNSAGAEVRDFMLRLAAAKPSMVDPDSSIRASLKLQGDALNKPATVVIKGEKELLEDLYVGPGESLSVEPGAGIKLAPGVSILISGGSAKFKGTKDNPIRISALQAAPWGSIIISDRANVVIDNMILEGGSEAYREFVRYEGALAAHNASLSVSNSQIDGLASFNATTVDLSNVTFKNLIPQMFLSLGARVTARNVTHIQDTPRHTNALLEQTPHGVPHTEREFKYTIHANWRTQELLQAAENLQSSLGRILSDSSKWKAPEFSTGGVGYSPDTKVGEFAYTDIYIDTDDNLNYKHDVSYRYRYRFENRKTFNNYVRNPDKPRFWPFRLEYQGKVGRGHPAPGLSEVYEARFELRKQSLPFSEEYLSPWTPWDFETYLPLMLSGSYKNISTISGAEIQKFLSETTGRSEFAFKPRLVVVTERLRQHLNIPTEWGSGPNPNQSNIITLDRSEIFDAKDFLHFLRRNKYGEPGDLFPQPVGVVTEMEIEFERNVSRELDKRLRQAKKDGNTSELDRLTRARQAFVDDLFTLRAEIVEHFKESNISVTPGGQSKYLQSYEIWKDSTSKRSPTSNTEFRTDRLVLSNEASQSEINDLLNFLSSNANNKGQKFVFSADQVLVVSTDDWRNASHDQLGRGRDIQTAGYIQSNHGTDELVLNNRSGDYCPSLESLQRVKEFIEQRSDVVVKLSKEPNEKCLIRDLFASKNVPQITD